MLVNLAPLVVLILHVTSLYQDVRAKMVSVLLCASVATVYLIIRL